MFFVYPESLPAESTCVSFWLAQCELCGCCCSSQRVLCESCPAHKVPLFPFPCCCVSSSCARDCVFLTRDMACIMAQEISCVHLIPQSQFLSGTMVTRCRAQDGTQMLDNAPVVNGKKRFKSECKTSSVWRSAARALRGSRPGFQFPEARFGGATACAVRVVIERWKPRAGWPCSFGLRRNATGSRRKWKQRLQSWQHSTKQQLHKKCKLHPRQIRRKQWRKSRSKSRGACPYGDHA